MRTGWGDRELDLPPHPSRRGPRPVAPRLAEQFPGERLVVPAGGFKVRANDTDYRFRAETAHTYLTGNQTSDAVLVIEGGEAVLYARPRCSRDDRRVLPRPAVRRAVGRPPPLAQGDLATPSASRPATSTTSATACGHRRRPGCCAASDRRVDALVAGDDGPRPRLRPGAVRGAAGQGRLGARRAPEACDITTLGFEDSVREWDRVLEHGERWLEGTFFRRARAMGNDIGYDSIVGGGSARHDPALDREHRPDHARRRWCCSTWAPRRPPSTPPTSPAPCRSTARSPPLQRDLYSLVLAAQQAGIDAVRPGAAFRAPARGRDARARPRARRPRAAAGLRRGGARPPTAGSTPAGRCTAPATCSASTCTTAPRPTPASTRAATLAEGMVLTVEPGLYFQEDDLLVPEELRGIGIRIEDDVVVTADGRPEPLRGAAPRPGRGRGLDGAAARLRSAIEGMRRE